MIQALTMFGDASLFNLLASSKILLPAGEDLPQRRTSGGKCDTEQGDRRLTPCSVISNLPKIFVGMTFSRHSYDLQFNHE